MNDTSSKHEQYFMSKERSCVKNKQKQYNFFWPCICIKKNVIRKEISMKTILIIEEERSIRQAMSFALGEEGYDVIATESFAEGHDILRSSSPGLVIINPDRLSKSELKVLQSYSAPVIFAMDSMGFPERITNSIRGAAADLSLPFALDTLLAKAIHSFETYSTGTGDNLAYGY